MIAVEDAPYRRYYIPFDNETNFHTLWNKCWDLLCYQLQIAIASCNCKLIGIFEEEKYHLKRKAFIGKKVPIENWLQYLKSINWMINIGLLLAKKVPFENGFEYLKSINWKINFGLLLAKKVPIENGLEYLKSMNWNINIGLLLTKKCPNWKWIGIFERYELNDKYWFIIGKKKSQLKMDLNIWKV